MTEQEQNPPPAPATLRPETPTYSRPACRIAYVGSKGGPSVEQLASLNRVLRQFKLIKCFRYGDNCGDEEAAKAVQNVINENLAWGGAIVQHQNVINENLAWGVAIVQHPSIHWDTTRCFIFHRRMTRATNNHRVTEMIRHSDTLIVCDDPVVMSIDTKNMMYEAVLRHRYTIFIKPDGLVEEYPNKKMAAKEWWRRKKNKEKKAKKMWHRKQKGARR